MQPTVKNLSYYEADTFSLILYPKDSTGEPIPLATATAYFRIADKRGDNPLVSLRGVATIQRSYEPDGPHCIIAQMSSEVGAQIETNYVYDIGFTIDTTRTTVLTGKFEVLGEVK